MHEFVEAFRFIAHNGAVAGQPDLPSLAHLALETLKVGAIGVAISIVIARAARRAGSATSTAARFVAINVGNIGRALPSLVVLAIGDAFLGLGLTVVELALVILAVPPIVTNAYSRVDGVDPDLVDAARGMGMSEREVLLRVELPLAVPLIFAGIRTAARVRDQHDDDRLARGLQRQPRRHHRQRDELPLLGRAGRGDLRGGAGARGRGRADAGAARAHAAGAARWRAASATRARSAGHVGGRERLSSIIFNIDK